MVLSAAALEGLDVRAMAPLMIQEALVLPAEGVRTVQVLIGRANGDAVLFEVVSRGAGEPGWKKHVSGRLLLGAARADRPAAIDLEAVRARCPERIEGADYYARVREMGLDFGEKFQGITRIWRGTGEAIGKVRLPETLALEAGQYHMHPALLDACFHLLGAPLPDLDEPVPYLLISLDRLEFFSRPGGTLWGHIVLTEGQDGRSETFVGDVMLYDEAGAPIAAVSGLSLNDGDAFGGEEPGQAGAIRAGALDASDRDRPERARPRQQGFEASDGRVEARLAEVSAEEVDHPSDVDIGVGVDPKGHPRDVDGPVSTCEHGHCCLLMNGWAARASDRWTRQ
jgi:acyl transferase domain-containing protein